MKRKLSIGLKLVLSLSAIALTLLSSCVISVMEYGRMSKYMSGLIADDINSINVAQRLSEMTNAYNLEILAVIGDDSRSERPSFDESYFTANCRELASSNEDNVVKPLADSVMYSYAAYMLTSLELEDVLKSDFIDSRTWFFERLQPRYERLHNDIGQLASVMHDELEADSSTFDKGFYRSIIPGMVAVGVGLLLVIMFLFFILSYYVRPLDNMLKSLRGYLSNDKKYNCKFEGDDQLSQLNDGISELAGENRMLRSRIAAMKLRKGQE